MWSLAGNQAVNQPIQQLCSWDLQEATPATLAWEALKRLCAWSGQPADPATLGLSLLGRRGRLVTESRGTQVRGFGPVGGAANLCSRHSRRFQVWVPLLGFMCVPPVR